MSRADLERLRRYVLEYGYSAERASELLGWRLEFVNKVKLEGVDMGKPTEEDIKRGVHMVLSGKSIEQAARAARVPVPQMMAAVHNAKAEINRLAKAAGSGSPLGRGRSSIADAPG